MYRSVAILACLTELLVQAQDSTWFDLSYPEIGCVWQMPYAPAVRDTFNVRAYSLGIDSTMAITAVFTKEVLPDTTCGSLFQTAYVERTQALLLTKIEELTLYVLQLEAELQAIRGDRR